MDIEKKQQKIVWAVITFVLHLVFFGLITWQAFFNLQESKEDASVAKDVSIAFTVFGVLIYPFSIFVTIKMG